VNHVKKLEKLEEWMKGQFEEWAEDQFQSAENWARDDKDHRANVCFKKEFLKTKLQELKERIDTL